jgi:phosphoglycolate phosphatase-like HAD superfamily hydrolase
MTDNIVYALDFDGVICDSAVETGMTGWFAAGEIWQDMPITPPTAMIDRFRQVRPIIETGYESILAMRLIFLVTPVAEIFSDFARLSETLLEEKGVTVAQLKLLFGQTRDEWIARDLSGWIEQNPLFDGIAEKLQPMSTKHTWYIITTKQERFVEHILKANGITLSPERIYGLDRNMSKAQVLKALTRQHSDALFYFVEDRLPTLFNIQNDPELAAVKLVFALWGYNTETDKQIAAEQPFILQTLTEFLS